jgi:HopA1 effector protein family
MLSPLSSLNASASNTLAAERLQAVLDDIAHHIKIQDNFCISHTHRTPLELSETLLKGLPQIPLSEQDRYLRWRFASYLYGIYDDGELQPSASNAEQATSHSEKLLQNKTVGIRSEFYHRLQHSNSGKGYFDSGWVVLKESADGLLAVQKDGLTMHVSRDRHLAETTVNFGDTVSVRLPNNQIENACYVAVGDRGPCPKRSGEQQNLNLYFNVTLEGILDTMSVLTAMLNELSLPFSFAVPYNLETYEDRCDVGMLSIEQQEYAKLQPSLAQFYQAHGTQFRFVVPLFAKVLAPGLGLSEQPLHSFVEKESFVMQRFQILAQGIISAWRQDLKSPEDRKTCMLQTLSQYQVDLNHPYLNPGSKDTAYCILEI